MLGLLKKWLFKDPNEKELERIQPIVDQINSLEPEMQQLSDADLKAKTGQFRERLDNGETLDDLLPEAFAVVREASQRATEEGFRHYDVQLIGGIVLHEGNIAEMKTGEGKTLAATLPAYLNALTGQGVHIITVNDYLAERDSEWMGQIYEFLGLEVGVILSEMDTEARKEAYQADITYGTNNEFGFDYLRDNMAISKDDLVQGELNFAILDEVDSILIDEARTPLIISGPTEHSPALYYKFAKVAPRLEEGKDYEVDEKANNVIVTEEGIERVEDMLNIDNLYQDENLELSHHLNQALHAQALMKRDEDYIVKDGEVYIVDEFTGRLMPGRRYGEGLHQAIEAKEGVKIQKETQTLASITFQNFFRMYNKLSGMTGTAATEAEEFEEIYDLGVVVIPTNEPMIRDDRDDLIYKTEEIKFRAVVEDIVNSHQQGQPVLVGTRSIEKSEELSRKLKRENIPHKVLNAKHHEQEAEIVKDAGQPGAVTIATNMAGRGTDIVLGEGVKEKGGLYVLGTERHESRRIDNQLRGRSGRQGDPGVSQFYVSLEDDLMRLFGSDKISGIMDTLGYDEDQPIEHPLISRSLENAQKKVEARNFEIRKQVLEYDNVMNQQRKIIYKQRQQILHEEDLKASIFGMIEKLIDELLDIYANQEVHEEEWDLEGLINYAQTLFITEDDLKAEDIAGFGREAIKEELLNVARENYEAREEEVSSEIMRDIEQIVMLKVVDQKWMDHLHAMDDLRQGIGLRAYGQRDPLIEYKHEAYDMFQNMIASIREDIVKYIFRIELVSGEMVAQEKSIEVGRGEVPTAYDSVRAQKEEQLQQAQAQGGEKEVKRQPIVKEEEPGRNDPCPCGSGEKYKRCCGR
ncbi:MULTISPECIES: preprotein translocase subunit SecA [unclassified Candidatus Frackibacter]|uniref:preprotein translocase subunit SecA n=1 Tax=unclassified Candidatus Frackibacter TaxID=2648818 RepID=UPI00088A3A7A|nr:MULTISPECIES: preprotein translocase subunit SecA [unclassified Candidatus Frackibacter]SDC83730.1 preprotein translocase subunit SecA [Candidatus Frackibacter sp. WG11]SEM98190.1 preprotein translocase subunit SecA [Candidatus Frackibacter sp. WG12]SFM04903.1 preprotein translocase subunit SecA [Candidatus Frackibacter sp. WG13]